MKKFKDLPKIKYEGHIRRLKRGLLFDSIYKNDGECIDCFHRETPLLIATFLMVMLLTVTLAGVM